MTTIMEYDTQLTINWEGWEKEVPLVVYYTSYPAIQAPRNEYGMPKEPDEPASVEIESIKYLTWDKDGKRHQHELPEAFFSDSMQDKLASEILQHYQEYC